MNYRHSYHAGNFADVLKHVLLARLIVHLKNKDSAFRYIDTHAGSGRYDLLGGDAERTGEWKDGVGRLWNATLPPAVSAVVAPWLEVVRALNPDGVLKFYPGSPDLVRALVREQDRLALCERHPDDVRTLGRLFSRDKQVSVVDTDGWTALNAYVPPKERRGVALIDPPFEQPNELERMAAALVSAHKKWPTGIYALWYPIKNPLDTEAFTRGLSKTGIKSILGAELMIQRPNDSRRLNGSGLAIVNPPWTLKAELGVLMPELARLLALDSHARGRVIEIAGEG